MNSAPHGRYTFLSWCLTDLPEVRDGVRLGALGGDGGRHPWVVLNLKGGGGERSHRVNGLGSVSAEAAAFFHAQLWGVTDPQMSHRDILRGQGSYYGAGVDVVGA